MKTLLLSFIAAFTVVTAQANNYEREGTYESGSCSESKSRENADSVYESGVPLLGALGGRKMQFGCCRSSVVAACGESLQEIANTNANGEVWAVCMRSVVFQRNTNEHGELPELATDCRSLSCRQWADDCRDLGIEKLRKHIKEDLPPRESAY